MMTPQEIKKLKGLARSTKGTFLIEFLEKTKGEVADVRTELKCKPEHDRDIRLAVCDFIDEMLIAPLKNYAEERGTPDPDEFK